jgi:SAM-dependent methyltransferase
MPGNRTNDNGHSRRFAAFAGARCFGRVGDDATLMKLWRTRWDWERFASKDPLWAVLSAPHKKGRRWAAEEFFLTGRHEVDAVLTAVRRVRPGLATGRALDFGCGVGRLTQGLADHFETVVGVDIAQSMLRTAEKHNRHGDRVRYVHNTRPDLSLFESGGFDFVLSLITLQHIAPAFSRAYIAEFVRLLSADGVAYFQVPYHVPVHVGDPPERLRFSTWPPTLLKRIGRISYRWAKGRWTTFSIRYLRGPVMDMYALPPADVVATVENAGGKVVESTEHAGAGQVCPSYAYVVQRR